MTQRSTPVTAEKDDRAVSKSFEVTDDLLLLRAIRNCRPRKAGHIPRWVVVMDLFAVGSTYARLLCKRFEYDPDELVKR